MLLPDRLRELWGSVDAGKTDRAAAAAEQERLLGELRERWRLALVTGGETDLRRSLLGEVARFRGIGDLGEVERGFDGALGILREDWEKEVQRVEAASVARYYENATIIDELMDWHTLRDDTGPLAYVIALDVARREGVGRCLDFGSGVGSGALLFRAAGIDTALADISSTMLDFCRWRFASRALAVETFDLKRDKLPPASFEMVLAMDVFEHLVEPIEVVDSIHATLAPGGFLYARIHAEEDADRPQHIARDFAPTFAHMKALGWTEVWNDGWLWGHQLFRKGR